MSPEQRQEWEDDEEALRRETAAAHAPAPESTESDTRAENAPGTIDPFSARRNSYRELILRHWRLKSDGYLWSIEDVVDAVTALADEEHAEAKREIASLHRDALAEAQAYRAMFARAQEAEAKVARVETLSDEWEACEGYSNRYGKQGTIAYGLAKVNLRRALSAPVDDGAMFEPDTTDDLEGDGFGLDEP